MINEGDMLWLYRPRVFNNYHGLSALASNTYNKKVYYICTIPSLVLCMSQDNIVVIK